MTYNKPRTGDLPSLRRSDTVDASGSPFASELSSTESPNSTTYSELQHDVDASSRQSHNMKLYFHDAPEVVETYEPKSDRKLLRILPHDPELVTPVQYMPNAEFPGYYQADPNGHPGALQWVPAHFADYSSQPSFVNRRPWFKSLVLWVIVASTFIISLAVGLGVGLSRSNGQISHGVATRFVSACNANNFCSQTLSAATYGRDFDLWIFSNAPDKTIQYQIGVYNTSGIKWPPAWTKLPGQQLVMNTAPAAWAWPFAAGRPRLDIWTVLQSNNSVIGRWFLDGVWHDWSLLDITSTVTPRLCMPDPPRFDIFILDAVTQNIAHNSWQTGSAQWDEIGGFDRPKGPAATNFALTCGKGSISGHDLVIYAGESVDYIQYIPSLASWTPWNQVGGSFVGEPVTFRSDNNPTELWTFGIGADLSLNCFSVMNTLPASPLQSLGGPFASTPSVASPATGMLDLVALDVAGTVFYRRFDGNNWSNTWVNLGFSSQTAPLLYNSNGFTHFFITGQSGLLQHSYWPTSPAADWTRISFKTMGINSNTTAANSNTTAASSNATTASSKTTATASSKTTSAASSNTTAARSNTTAANSNTTAGTH